MAKRQEEAPKAGAPEWMATFSDLMNLLLCFFVLLFAMSSVDEEKYTSLVASMQSSFSIFEGGAMAIGEGTLLGQGVSQLNLLDKYMTSAGKAAESESESQEMEEYQGGSQGELEDMAQALKDAALAANEELAEKVAESVAESRMADQIEVSFTADFVQLSLRGALLFDSGKSQIRDDAIPVLAKVGDILDRYSDGTVEVEGHTDNVPISSARFANNNELSSARALSVFDFLLANTALDPADVKHAGRGEYVPIADNATPEGRAINRRVEIRIYNPVVGTAQSEATETDGAGGDGQATDESAAPVSGAGDGTAAESTASESAASESTAAESSAAENAAAESAATENAAAGGGAAASTAVGSSAAESTAASQ